MVFNLNKRCIEFQTEAGHSETIFDVEFCGSNPDYMASCSYDGTVRIWDANRMKLVSVCDTLRQTPQSKKDKRIIYAISWHPESTKLCLVTIHGHCMIYDALKAKLLSHCTPSG
jgi:WD40 repeat protein